MHVQHPCGAAAFVQVIDILGDQQQIARKLALKPRQRRVRRIGHDIGKRGAAHVVEFQHKAGVAGETLGRGDILHTVLFPQPPGAAEGIDPALRGNACAGEDDDALRVFHFIPLSSP